MPLAALLVGQPNERPALREKIPELPLSDCDHAGAKRAYLLAYAYLRDRPLRASEFFSEAEQKIRTCGSLAEVLRERMAQLRKDLFP